MDKLQAAEDELEATVHQWPTDQLDRLVNQLPARNVAAYQLPYASRAAYNLLWGALGHLEATQLVRYLATQALAGRSFVRHQGPCPGCGYLDAEVTVYDRGWYVVARHPGAAVGTMRQDGEPIRLPARCYVGEEPKPETYQGTL